MAAVERHVMLTPDESTLWLMNGGVSPFSGESDHSWREHPPNNATLGGESLHCGLVDMNLLEEGIRPQKITKNPGPELKDM